MQIEEDGKASALVIPVNPDCTRCGFMTTAALSSSPTNPHIGWKCSNCYAFYRK